MRFLTKKKNEMTWKNVMDFRNEMFGFCAIWIVLFHVLDNIGFPDFRGSYVLEHTIAIGNSGVDIFLFLSAIGLCHSMEKNSLNNFYRNRLLRICVPYLLAAIPFFLWYDFIVYSDGFWKYILNLTSINYWIDSSVYPIWYVSFVIILYSIYPVLYNIDRKTKHKATVLLIVLLVAVEYVLFLMENPFYDNSERALTRIPVFLLGMIMAPSILNGERIPRRYVALAFIVWFLCFLFLTRDGLYRIWRRYIYCIMAVCFVVMFAFLGKYCLDNAIGRGLRWLGNISFEIYVVHVFLIRVIRYYVLWDLVLDKFCWYVILPVISVLAAQLLKRCSVRINDVLWKKQSSAR